MTVCACLCLRPRFQELRIACALAQMEREGGVSAVISPLAQVRPRSCVYVLCVVAKESYQLL